MAKYILIGDEVPEAFSIDTTEERDAAEQALIAEGRVDAAVYVGDPEDPSSYATGEWFRIDPDTQKSEIHLR